MVQVAEPTPRTGLQRGGIVWLRARMRVLAPLLTLLIMVVFFSVAAQGSFLTFVNLMNILAQTAPLAALAIGETFVILCAEIDLSVANMAVMGTVILIDVMGSQPGSGAPPGLGWPEWVAILLAIGACTLAGFINGVVTTVLSIPSFMVTLAMLEITIGVVTYVTQGQTLYLQTPSFTNTIGSSSVAQVPVIAIVAIALLIIAALVLRYTRFGRYIYIVGGNKEAAELSGINARRVIMWALTISGFCTGIASVMYVGRLGTAQPSGLGDILIYAIAAVVLGGTSLFGGEGGIANTVIGLLILGVLQNGLNQISIDQFLKVLIYGIILLVALVVNVFALRLGNADTA